MGEETFASRRDFLKGAGLTAAAVAGTAALSGTAFADEAEDDGIEWEGEYDVIVCGAGAAGCTAAITVADEGDGATCLLIEKGDVPGGNSRYSAGYALTSESAEDVLVYLKELTGEATTDDVLEAYAEGLCETRDWIFDLSPDETWIAATSMDTTGEKTGEYPELTNDHCICMVYAAGVDGGPTHLWDFLFDRVGEREAITYLPSTPLESLIQDSDGTVIGVVANGLNYKANKGVIVCTGGFESDEDMLFNYTGVSGVKPYAGVNNTGDGIKACMKVGAGLWHMHGGAQYWLAARNIANERFMSVTWNFTTKQYGITVAVNGQRFYMDYDSCSCCSSEADSVLAENIGYRHGITQYGGNWTHLPLPPQAWFIFDQAGLEAGAVPTTVSEDPVGDEWAYTADTIEELADIIGVPSDELVKTVELWNTYCEEGEDLSFHRPADTLTPVATAPFYAMLCVPAMLNTDGGPVRSGAGEVLDVFGDPIPHLYSAGEMGSLWGHYYQGAGNLGECLVFGRISARSALAN